MDKDLIGDNRKEVRMGLELQTMEDQDSLMKEDLALKEVDLHFQEVTKIHGSKDHKMKVLQDEEEVLLTTPGRGQEDLGLNPGELISRFQVTT